MGIGQRIKKRREELKLSQEELADKMGYKSRSSVNKIEAGLNDIPQSKIVEFAKHLRTTSSYLMDYDMPITNYKKNNQENVTHKTIIDKYSQLDSYGKKAIDQLLNTEYNRVNEQSKHEEIERRYHTEQSQDIDIQTYPKPNYLTSLSAGNGLTIFKDIMTDVINVPPKYKCADFVIGVSGDSMQPTYNNDDRVAIKKKPSIEIGEVGVFIINDEGYIKELGHDRLISHNEEYPDIAMDDSIVCVGRVLGKL